MERDSIIYSPHAVQNISNIIQFKIDDYFLVILQLFVFEFNEHYFLISLVTKSYFEKLKLF